MHKNLTSAGWAQLHGPAIKAAATRSCAPWLRQLCVDFLAPDTERNRLVLQLATDLVAFYEILYATGRFLSDEELGRFKEVCERFGTNYQALREHSRVVKLLHFKVTPKVHKMQHLPLLSEVLNPRWVQNYCEESLVGTSTHLG